MEDAPVAQLKKQIQRAKVSERMLVEDMRGLRQLYEISCGFEVTGTPKQDLDNLMTLFQQWHFDLAPKFEMKHFIAKCQVLGTKPQVKAFMSRLRKVHLGEATWQDFDNEEHTPLEEGSSKRKNSDVESNKKFKIN